RSVDGVRWLREHPAAWAIGLIAAAALRPRGVFGFARNGFRLWAAWQALRVPKARLAARVLPQVLDWYRTWKSRRR
ncbi:MAG: hypothetical protein H7125_07400, partial [Proteobacteria bacterium]|nr:hypothetical protein [Burkholderiales bacterium]